MFQYSIFCSISLGHELFPVLVRSQQATYSVSTLCHWIFFHTTTATLLNWIGIWLLVEVELLMVPWLLKYKEVMLLLSKIIICFFYVTCLVIAIEHFI